MSKKSKNVNIPDWELNYDNFLKLYNEKIIDIFKDIEPERLEILEKYKKTRITSWFFFLSALTLLILFYTNNALNPFTLLFDNYFVLSLILVVPLGVILMLAAMGYGAECFFGRGAVNKEFKEQLKKKSNAKYFKRIWKYEVDTACWIIPP